MKKYVVLFALAASPLFGMNRDNNNYIVSITGLEKSVVLRVLCDYAAQDPMCNMLFKLNKDMANLNKDCEYALKKAPNKYVEWVHGFKIDTKFANDDYIDLSTYAKSAGEPQAKEAINKIKQLKPIK